MNCPKCNSVMYYDGYLIDITKDLSEVQIICKDDNLRKKQFPLKYYVCSSCGYIEAYADVKEKMQVINSKIGEINKDSIIDKEAEMKRNAQIKGATTIERIKKKTNRGKKKAKR